MKYKLKKMMFHNIKETISIYTFTMILLFIGIIFGAIIVNSLSIDQKSDLHVYLSRFFGQVSDGHFGNSADLFKQSFAHYLKYTGLLWVLGLSVIGLPIILILLFLKGIVIGFTVGFLVSQMSWKGFLLSFVTVLPQNMILVPAFIIIGTAAIGFSLKKIRIQLKKNEPFIPLLTRYSFFMAATIAFIVMSSSIEAYLSPLLMKNVVAWLN